MRKLILYIVAIMLFVACKKEKNVPVESNVLEERLVEKGPQLLFLNYKMQKGASLPKATFINKIISDGQQKKEEGIGFKYDHGDLKITQSDRNNNELQSNGYDNPLLMEIEYVNDDGSFERKTISPDSVEFSARITLLPKTSSVAVSVYDSTKQSFQLLDQQSIENP